MKGFDYFSLKSLLFFYFYAEMMDQVHFYAGAYHFFSNFSAFEIEFQGEYWKTSEHAYQALKFIKNPALMKAIQVVPSPYEAKKIAEYYAELQRADWNVVKRDIMGEIIRAKYQQHFCIQRKLLETYGKEMIEVSPQDSYWGRGPDQKGRNELGKIWMQIREEAVDQIRAGKLISSEELAQKLEERINQIKLQEREYYASLLE